MKTKLFLILFVVCSPIYSQQIDFNSPQNIKLFADFLFCDKDYLRAIDEYERYLNVIDNDTVQFKIALGFSLMNDQFNALQEFSSANNSSTFYEQSGIEILKSLYLLKDYSNFYVFGNDLINSKSRFSNNAQKLLNTSILITEKELPDENIFFKPFENEEKLVLGKFYDQKLNPPYKSEFAAGIFSAIIPGAGKIYTEDYGDGITAFLLTGLFSYLAYTNFDHNHPTRGWIFTALGAGFYAGNVYGSIASAQIFNAKVNFDFENGLKIFLEDKNYFTPTYDFCK
ncbi:MAG: hypothetical protein Q8M94_12335 [Ignavibacteria bacterium]|nr:hypothetical protein [Ignavibacteria bacterium]